MLLCMNVSADDPERTSTIQPKRLGPNPLDQFLSDDD